MFQSTKELPRTELKPNLVSFDKLSLQWKRLSIAHDLGMNFIYSKSHFPKSKAPIKRERVSSLVTNAHHILLRRPPYIPKEYFFSQCPGNQRRLPGNQYPGSWYSSYFPIPSLLDPPSKISSQRTSHEKSADFGSPPESKRYDDDDLNNSSGDTLD